MSKEPKHHYIPCFDLQQWADADSRLIEYSRQGPALSVKTRPTGNGALRLTTARYFTLSGRSIQAKGISPDIEVLQEVPDDLKVRTDTKGEASLRGHLKAEGTEESGSQSYVPPDEKDDRALKEALDLLRAVITDAAFPPNPKAAVPN
jgi:carboxyl-terminal processing protease